MAGDKLEAPSIAGLYTSKEPGRPTLAEGRKARAGSRLSERPRRLGLSSNRLGRIGLISCRVESGCRLIGSIGPAKGLSIPLGWSNF